MSKKYSQICFGCYLFFLVWLIMFKLSINLPVFFQRASGRSLNLIPFVNDGGTREMLLNVLAFVPLGWFLRKVTHFKWFSALSVIFLITLIFETLQYIFAIGASDINDILMNSLGGGIGLILFQLLKDKSKQKIGNGLEIVLFALMLLILLLQIVHHFGR